VSTWPLHEAKNRLSEVVDRALDEGPQTVTRHGKEVVVILSKVEFDRGVRARSKKGSLVPFLRGLGFAGAELDLSRSQDEDREEPPR
jgi:prevent-host-death family protein